MKRFGMRGLSLFAVASAAVNVGGCELHAQSRELSWLVRPVKSFYDRASGRAAVYGPTEAIEFEVSLLNESRDPLGSIVLDDGFFDKVVLGILLEPTGESIKMSAHWESVAVCHGVGASPLCSTQARTVLRPGQSVTATVRLVANEPGTFSPANYRITADFRPAQTRILHGI